MTDEGRDSGGIEDLGFLATDGTDDADLCVDLEDDSGAVVAAVGRQIRLWRESAGLRAKDLGDAIGYRVCSQCTGLQSGGEANLRTVLSSAVCMGLHCWPQ
ncbi:hypothetical protein AB0D98_14205, partial [Streptomyces sp. NPDC047987]